uniref:Uncharacterized protein n=1 Tax=Glossina pallidipes TaxID=7398 RepID=A0A1A9ZGT7_GLOPL
MRIVFKNVIIIVISIVIIRAKNSIGLVVVLIFELGKGFANSKLAECTHILGHRLSLFVLIRVRATVSAIEDLFLIKNENVLGKIQIGPSENECMHHKPNKMIITT